MFFVEVGFVVLFVLFFRSICKLLMGIDFCVLILYRHLVILSIRLSL